MNALRGRIGIRLAYNKEGAFQRTNTFYAIGNIWHDFSSTKPVQIGRVVGQQYDENTVL